MFYDHKQTAQDLKEKQKKKKIQQHLTTSGCVLDEGLQRLDCEADVDRADSLSVLKRDLADLTQAVIINKNKKLCAYVGKESESLPFVKPPKARGNR